MALVLGILFFIGYGVYLNADHLPFNLITDLFNKDPTNYFENLKNNKTDDLINDQNISNGNLSSNQKSTGTQADITKNQTKTYRDPNNQNSNKKFSNQQTKSSIGDNSGQSGESSSSNNGDSGANDSVIPDQTNVDENISVNTGEIRES